jgi:protein SCO1
MATISKKGNFLSGDLEIKSFGKKFVISKKGLFYIIFFMALVAVFYWVLITFNPQIGEKSFPPVSYVRPFSFTNQDGQKITEKDMAGKVYVAEYFFTTCKGICPKMNSNMRMVYERFKENNNFLILSHTCDLMGVDTRHWVFLTGRKDSLYTMARISYVIDDPKNNLRSINDDFLHTQLWALVDKKGNVRNTYDGLKKSEVKQLMKDAERLMKEK